MELRAYDRVLVAFKQRRCFSEEVTGSSHFISPGVGRFQTAKVFLPGTPWRGS